MSDKTIPIPVLQDSYVTFRKEVSLWETITPLQEERRGGTLVIKLPEKAKSIALDMSHDELAKGIEREDKDGNKVKITGVQRLLEVLDDVYMENIHKEKFKCYDNFRNYRREKLGSVQDFLLEYDKKVRRLKEYGINLPEEVLAYEVLNSANLSVEQYALANATVPELTYKAMKDQIKKIALNSSASPTKHMMTVVKEDTYYNVEDHFQELDCDYDQRQHESYYANRGNYNRGRSRYNPNNWQGRRPTQSTPSNQRRGMYRPRGGYNNNTRMRGSKRSVNPRDQYGNIMLCHICKGNDHFARDCTQDNQYYNNTEEVALFQNTPKADYSVNKMNKFTSDNFGLAVLDTGCNVTVCGREWLKAFLESLNEEDAACVRSEQSSMYFRFGDNEPTLSNERYTLPATVCNKEVKIITEVVEDRIPLLISKRTMETAKMVVDFGDYTVTAFGYTQKMIRTESGHCSITLNKKNVYDDVCLCSQGNVVELFNGTYETNKKKIALKLHKQFAHLTPHRLKSLIRMAGKQDKELFDKIDEISRTCDVCIRHKRPESRPIVCMPIAKQFNNTVSMDLKCFDTNKGIYFQHMIDNRTRFSTAKVIRSKNKETLVESVFTHWIALFGRPRKIMSDNGGEYNNSSFIDMCDKLGVHVITTGAEAPWSNGLVERHHDLIARNVKKIIEETGCRVETALAWAVNAKNCLSNVNGFTPYQLLLGITPNLPSLDDPYEHPTTLENETPSERVAEHIKAIYNARKQQMAVEADEKIRRALAHKTRDVFSKQVKQGDLVYYKRDNSDRWKGPATVIGTDRKIVFLRHGGFQIKCHICRIINVNEIYNKSDTVPNSLQSEEVEDEFFKARELMSNEEYVYEDEQTIEENDDAKEIRASEENNEPSNSLKVQKLCDKKSNLEKKKICIDIITNKDPYAKEKQEELQKWIDNDVFEEVDVNSDEVTQNEDINPISVTWVYTDTENKRKARLVARGFQDEPLQNTETVSPTCRKESLRLLFSITASNSWTIKSLDITSAFLQGKQLDRTVYLIPPKEYKKKNVLWKLKKCVYGLSDAARMWYDMIKEQVESANIEKCPHDDAFFYWSANLPMRS